VSFSTSDLFDAHPDEVGVCACQFRGFGQVRAFSGPAATLLVGEDHHLLRAVAAEAGEGRVLVVEAGGATRVGVLGDMIARKALANGWAGAVVHGAVRDSVALDAMGFGVKALGTTARRSPVDRGGVRDGAVAIGGVVIRAGDWIYADDDAVLVSPRRLTQDVGPDANG